MSTDGFGEFFHAATGASPYPYQERLAAGEGPGGAPASCLVHVPTGAGKTAAVVLAWLWNRCGHPEAAHRARWPRRLVYCLPMRVLVEQTHGVVEQWLDRLTGRGLLYEQTRGHILMAGEVEDEWALFPERSSILIGTQDMLLSRALNRGYAESRFHWPVSFGLLNNDTLWVLDEVQLMGPGLTTTAQLAAFRESVGVLGACPTIWMSATLSRDWLTTVDFYDAAKALTSIAPGKADVLHPALKRRLEARKTLRQARRFPGWKDKGYSKAVAELVLGRQKRGSLSLVVVNTVDRAKEIYRSLQKAAPAAGGTDLVLVHSRFRPPERKALTNRMLSALPSGGRIVVATQVVEAGVDISARLLVTELAPWASLVQRFGRCNRTGDDQDSEVIWLDTGTRKGMLDGRLAAPYETEHLEAARRQIRPLEGKSVAPVHLPAVVAGAPISQVLRRKDLMDLFDTAADISGLDLDVGRFIRDADEHEVHVFWRAWEGGEAGEPPPKDFASAVRDELCPAPVGQVRELLDRGHPGYSWDHLDGQWVRVRGSALRPGLTVLLPRAAGGYSWDAAQRKGLGWDATSEDPVEPVPAGLAATSAPDSSRHDPASRAAAWVRLADHTDAVVREADSIVVDLNLEAHLRHVIHLAARWHDAGKAHHVFQDTLRRSSPELPAPREAEVWAKSPGQPARHSRPHFRHELASALALLSEPTALEGILAPWRDTVPYLVASHHGKVRLAVRSLPGELAPTPARRFMLGVWDGDPLPEADLGGGCLSARRTLNLACFEMGLGEDGQPSWMDRMLRLRDQGDVGPFRLAYLEAILRAADARASASVPGEGKTRA